MSIDNEFWDQYRMHRAKNPDYDDQKWIDQCFNLFVFPEVPFFKHEGFSEEGEWRLVSRPLNRRDLLVRPGTTFPITYTEFPLLDPTGASIEGQLAVGPGSSQELASHGAAVAAERSKIRIRQRRYSLTPLRTGSA